MVDGSRSSQIPAAGRFFASPCARASCATMATTSSEPWTTRREEGIVPSSQVVHIIDDDVDVRQALAFLLTTAGLAVQVHESAVAFLNARPRPQAGCIVTDIRMPGMDGLELQRKLLADQNHVPVIIMTGHADVALAVEAMKAGAVDFVEKPFDNE